jgi:hypothetical protein
VPEVTDVDLGVFAPGTSLRVEADGRSCTIDIPIVSECSGFVASETRVPRVVFPGQPLSATLTMDAAGGCGCTPSASLTVDASTVAVDARLCGCCELCDCIDSGYQASVVVDAPPLGDYTLEDGTGQIAVRDPTTCRALEPTSLELVGPRDDLSVAGPRLWWAAVSGEQSVCCVEPIAGVREAAVGAAGIHLELLGCVREDCACVPPGPTPFTTWYALGELPSGVHSVRAGDHEATVTVP